jgi:tRNA pseudouridine32 synthase/23S rRNA pseudouridine746 synthase
MIVHRLDMDTSGLMVVALTADAQRALSREFELRRVDKAYTALVEGADTPDHGLIDIPIRLDPANRPYQVIDWVDGRPAQTRYRVLSRETDRTRVRLEPITGRTHQLRVHAAAPRTLTRIVGQRVPGGLGAPILGDVLYGKGERTAPRLTLHACELTFRSPSGEPISCTCAPEF